MATLKKTDFAKPAAAGPYAGKTRHEIFTAKIKDKKPFIIGPSKSGKEVIGISYTFNKSTHAGNLIYTTKGSKKKEEVANTKIFKDGDFGGGSSGSGGGAEDTKYTESTQCYYCALVFKQKKPLDLKKPPTTTQLKSAASQVYASKSLEDCLKNGPQSWFEQGTYIKTANLVYKQYKNKFKGTVYFHRAGDGSKSKFMDNVYKAKQTCHNNDKKSKVVQAPGSFSNDKWNPGDIWATTLSNEAKPLEKYTKDWSTLNKAVAEMSGVGKAQSATLLGISLKSIAGGSMGTYQEYNLPKKHGSEVKFTNFQYGQKNNFFSAKDSYIYTNKGRMQLRTFGGDAAWQGEIKGVAAAGGKIGGGNIVFYLQRVTRNNVMMFGNSGKEGHLISDITKTNFAKTFYKYYVDLAKSAKNMYKEAKPMSFELFESQLKDTDKGFKVSKYITTVFLVELIKLSGKDSSQLMTDCWSYAASSTDQSSFFIKIS